MTDTIKSWEIAIDLYPEQNSVHVGMPTGVKITHHATGAIVICTSEPSQYRNRQMALAGLQAMLDHKENQP